MTSRPWVRDKITGRGGARLVRLCAGVLAVGLLAGLLGCPPQHVPGAFQVTNAAPGVIVTDVYLVPSGAPHWGSNRLLAPLAYGQSFVVGGLEPGYYDEMALVMFPESGDTDRLINRTVLIAPGQTFTHLVHFVAPWP